MKILILGAGGMLGHQLWRQLQRDHEVWVTVRRPLSAYERFGLFKADRTIASLDVTCADSLMSVVGRVRPEAMINCVGIIKQLKEASNPVISIMINSLLPHRLAELAAAVGARLIHVSTDCVFSGEKGGYVESDRSDAEDMYGRTKFLGEVIQSHCVTLRTSIVGRELETKSGLIEWFLSQKGKTIRGFRRSVYTGFTTPELARIIETVLLEYPRMYGLWHVSSERIDKFELLKKAERAFGWKGEIVPDDTCVCDRSLDSTRFRTTTKYVSPCWDAMLEELASLHA